MENSYKKGPCDRAECGRMPRAFGSQKTTEGKQNKRGGRWGCNKTRLINFTTFSKTGKEKKARGDQKKRSTPEKWEKTHPLGGTRKDKEEGRQIPKRGPRVRRRLGGEEKDSGRP